MPRTSVAPQLRARQERADSLETREWIASIEEVLARRGRARVRRLLEDLQIHAQHAGVTLPVTSQTPYVNTIRVAEQAAHPGNLELEARIEHLVRWNAMAMVVRANRHVPGIGGHISTYASIATLYEVGFNHFFRGRDHECGGDIVYFQGHASPGNYARAFLEGRLDRHRLDAFRLELSPDGGLPSYPHPWLMEDFWEFPTVSMGLGPIQAIYQARFRRYLEHRGLVEPADVKVWCFVGDGECDEPETLAAISLAAREGLDNLVFVVNCNLQRLDGPVRGNGKIVQELEAAFRGVGWNAIKVLWGGAWDELLARDDRGLLVRRLGELLDGDEQRFAVEGGAAVRELVFESDQRLADLVGERSDDDLAAMRFGGHDPVKVYAAYRAAVAHRGSPTVILAKTVKGYGLGEAGEGRNVTHKQKKLNEQELLEFRDRFDIPLSDDEVADAPFYRPDAGSPEMEYLGERRRALGGFVPERRVVSCAASAPGEGLFEEFHGGTGDRHASTTMALVRLLGRLLRDATLGPRIVPIVPDEARTFGMEALFRQAGIYSSAGQLYRPVDAEHLLHYREATDGQILEEGITEAGSMSSFIAAGTAHANHGTWCIPFFFFYSMFGFQRIGDLIWAAGDARARGFLIGATAGRTTLNGEGLQHQDGHSHVLASTFPNVRAYDPAYAYEVAAIVADGLRRMYRDERDELVYLTAYNEPYAHPEMPAGAREGIVRGLYRLRETIDRRRRPRACLLGSGPILEQVIEAQAMLAGDFGVPAEVWSATSYSQLRRDALAAERWNRLHPAEPPRTPYVTECFEKPAVFVAASDSVKALPDSIARWLPGPLVSLGTDGFGRSHTRAGLRDFFEIDARHICVGALYALAREGELETAVVEQAIRDLDVNPEKLNPAVA